MRAAETDSAGVGMSNESDKKSCLAAWMGRERKADALVRWPGRRKYDPLREYLVQCAEDRVTLALSEIEAIIAAPLPPSATSSQFWSNYERSWPAPVWRSVGWRVGRFPPRTAVEAVTFEREPIATDVQPLPEGTTSTSEARSVGAERG
jgi:hypothetical protein